MAERGFFCDTDSDEPQVKKAKLNCGQKNRHLLHQYQYYSTLHGLYLLGAPSSNIVPTTISFVSVFSSQPAV